MVYNPIFEEEIESKKYLKTLKKDIKIRAGKESMKNIIGRVYNLLQKKPISSLFQPIIDLVKTSKAK